MRALTVEQIERFWSNVNKGSQEHCWPWRGGTDSNGYGWLSLNNKPYRAHQISFFLSIGVWPSGIIVRHTCDNPICCNPSHLVEGTQKDNMRDCVERGRNKLPPIRAGSQNNKTTLIEEEVLKIRELGLLLKPSQILRLPEFAGRISLSSLCKILARKSWTHI